MNFLIYFSSGWQLCLLKKPSFLSNAIIKIFYVLDVLNYSLVGAQKFLLKRKMLLGPNFAALGRIIIGEYSLAAKIIAEPQQRGAYIGRFRCLQERFSKNFLLFLSDKEFSGDDAHLKAREAVWNVALGPALERTSSKEAQDILEEFAILVQSQGNPPELDDISDDIQHMIVQYIMFVILGVKLSKQQIDTLKTLFFSINPRESLLTSKVKPLAPPSICLNKVERLEAIALEIIEQSPVVNSYKPSSENDMNRRDLSILLMQAIAIAGCLGSENLIRSLLTKIPLDLEINLDKREEVLRVVLETARRYAPVNNINTISCEEATVMINGKEHKLPKGTTFAANIGLANLDGNVFEEPFTFNPQRENLFAALSFNSVGEAKRRECPGRGIAETMGCDFLAALRQSSHTI